MRSWILLVLAAATLLAQQPQELEPLAVGPLGRNALVEERPDRGARVWKISVATLAVASVVDAHSSWGKCCESNRLLRSQDGRFGGRAAMIKAGALGGQMFFQSYAAKRSRKMRTLFTIVNFGTAFAMSAAAAHNYGIPRPAR